MLTRHVPYIVIHQSPDLDALSSLVFAQLVFQTASPTPIFRSAKSSCDDVDEQALILDMDANGRGIKGTRDSDGKIHSCFAYLVEHFGTEQHKKALSPLVRFIDAEDMSGNVIRQLCKTLDPETAEVLLHNSLRGTFDDMRYQAHGDDAILVELMCPIIRAKIQHLLHVQNMKDALANEVVWYGENNTIAYHATKNISSATRLLFSMGAKVVVYDNPTGFGALRGETDAFQLNHQTIKDLIAAHGESEEWFFHTAGFLAAHGSLTAPQTKKSNILPEELIQAILSLINQQ